MTTGLTRPVPPVYYKLDSFRMSSIDLLTPVVPIPGLRLARSAYTPTSLGRRPVYF